VVSSRILAFVACATLFGVARSQTARGGELGESPIDPSAFSTVIDARQYDDRFATVQELLDQAPGVRVSRYGGLGAYSTASIRGSKAEQVLVLLDGVRMNSAERGAFDLSTLPVRQVERIEVLRGAGAQRYGSDAVGGVISITTRRPDAGSEPSVDGSLTAGSYETFGGDVSVSGAGDWGNALASYSRLRSTNDYDFDVAPPPRGGRPRPGLPPPSTEPSLHTRLNAQFVEDSGLLRGALALGASSRLEAMVDLYRKDAGEPGSTWNKSLTGATDEELSCPLPRQWQDRGVGRLAWIDDAVGRGGRWGGLELSASTRMLNNDLSDPGGACGLVDQLVTKSEVSGWQERSSALDGGWRLPQLDWFDGELRLRGHSGATLEYDTVNPSGADDQRRTTVLLTTQPELALWDGALRLFPALAWEHASTSEGQVRTAAFAPLAPYAPRDETGWLPGIGGILEVAPGLQLKANWKRVFQRPTFTELFHPDWGTVRGNPTLRAERGWNADVGFELSAPGRGFVSAVSLEADVFQRELDESIEWVLANQAFMPLNLGPARVQGVEVATGATLFQRLALTASYTHQNARYLGDAARPVAFTSGADLRFPHVAENTFTGSASFDLGPARLWGEARYEGKVNLAVGGLYLVAPTTQVDAGVTLYPRKLPGLDFLPERFSLTVEGTNLTGEQRIDSLATPLPKRPLWLVRLRGATP